MLTTRAWWQLHRHLHVRCLWTEPLNSVLDHAPLEVLLSCRARGRDSERNCNLSTGRHREWQWNAILAPPHIVLQVLRAKPVVAAGLPRRITNVLHRDRNVVSLTDIHRGRHRLRDELCLVGP